MSQNVTNQDSVIFNEWRIGNNGRLISRASFRMFNCFFANLGVLSCPWSGARSRLDDWHGPHVDGKCGRGISLM